MTMFLLNSPVMTDFGLWRYSPISVHEAQSLLSGDERVVSAIGHESTARAISELMGGEVKVNRVRVSMQPGDRALVFSLPRRLSEGEVLDWQDLSKVGLQIGLMERVDA